MPSEIVDNGHGTAKSKKKLEDIYQKKTQLEHILLRPDTYIGSIEFVTQSMWVFDSENKKMVFRNVQFVPGLYKIFDEILVNAADNKIRDPSMSVIKVDIDRSQGYISIYNDGKGIPIEIHATEKVYIPELIFGHLLTSSNYDDMEKKVTGGRNGYGAKLCNIFSSEFIVETADLSTKKKFKQTFRENMSIKSDPHIINNNREEFTKITFKPDFSRFKMEGIDQDLYSLFSKRVYDLSGCVKDIKVYFNGERIPVRNFKQYTELYFSSSNSLPKPDSSTDSISENDTSTHLPNPVYETFSDGRWEICVALSDGQFQHVSFVNSIYTYKGGTHLTYVSDQIVAHLVDHIKKKNKSASNIKPFQVKNHLWIFLNCLIENPSFDSQTKEYMTLNVSSFGSKCGITEEFMKKVLKSGVVNHVMEWVKQKQDKELKKTDGHKSSRLSGIAKLDDANMAGTRQASKCTLILTEGDSAKALAVSGLSVVGRDHYGVFPLRGKLLNVREANHKQIMENSEINQIKQITGLQHGKEYTSTDTLRYGHIMIMTDQDHDGSHIKGLLINMLEYFWPSLLKIPGFLLEFVTPIVKATKGRQEFSFYTIPEYEKWKQLHDDGKGYFIKYYKGLGTSTAADAKKYFSSMKTHLKEFDVIKSEERSLVDMAFNKKKADERKEWLKTFKPDIFMDHSVEKICYSDFIHHELILFSMADNIRSIPSMVDGLKPGLRKVLYACFKRKLVKEEIKLAQLAGYISEHTAYHHGEASLCSSITGMAQDFVGSNNINLLLPLGQFGTRIQGGKDAASPRYIFTKLSPLSRFLFHPEDDPLLKYLNDDGQSIEPEWYIPIIPMVMVNGSEGIGTGWSSYIPNFSPRDIVINLLRKLDGEPFLPMHPWYRGFKGTLEQISTDKYRVHGKITKIDNVTVHITELPIGTWTQTYKEFLETLISSGEKTPAFIRDYKEYHTDTSVHFVVKLSEENMRIAEDEGLDKKFRISTTISLANMVCFDHNFSIRKYSSPEEILEEFYELRLGFYQKRKEYLTEKLTTEWSKLDNKVRFITEIIDGELVIHKKKKELIISELKARQFKAFSEKSEDSLEDNANMYDYLLSMPLWSLTFERVEKLNNEKKLKEEELNKLLVLTPRELWRIDLRALLDQLNTQDYMYSLECKNVMDIVVENKISSSKPDNEKSLPLSQRIALMLNDHSIQNVNEACTNDSESSVKVSNKNTKRKSKKVISDSSSDESIVQPKKKSLIIQDCDDVIKTRRKKTVKYMASSDSDAEEEDDLYVESE